MSYSQHLGISSIIILFDHMSSSLNFRFKNKSLYSFGYFYIQVYISTLSLKIRDPKGKKFW